MCFNLKLNMNLKEEWVMAYGDERTNDYISVKFADQIFILI
jgi:hypothetical protein